MALSPLVNKRFVVMLLVMVALAALIIAVIIISQRQMFGAPLQ